MTELPSRHEIGVLRFLPDTIRFLADPAIRFSGKPADEITETERDELKLISRRVLEGDFFESVEEFLEKYSMTEFVECVKLLELFRLFDRLKLIYRNYLLSFVTDQTGTMVSVHLDLKGANYLIETLEYIRDSLVADQCPHDHLFVGDELTSTMLSDQDCEQTSVGHVKIYGWNDEWAKKHKLRPN